MISEGDDKLEYTSKPSWSDAAPHTNNAHGFETNRKLRHLLKLEHSDSRAF
jgi:hypothetical protein